MLINATYTRDFPFNPTYLFRATIRGEVNLTYNGSNMDIVSVNSKKAYQYGSSLNFDNWKTSNITVTTSNNYFAVNIKGSLTFSYTDPLTGLKASHTYNNVEFQWGQRLQ
jgi:hypothetical protein